MSLRIFLCLFQIITTDFGLRVQYDGGYRAEITLPDTYKNITCGLCGTYDDQQDNEYTKKNGLVVSISEFMSIDRKVLMTFL